MARGMMAPVDAARPISNIVDTCLAALLAAAKPEFEKANGNIPNDRVALVALGAAGRRELATGAPFEILFVYDHDPVPAGTLIESPQAWHDQLLQRLMVLIRDLSPEGMLFAPVPPCVLQDADSGSAACSMQRLGAYLEGEPTTADLRMLTHARVVVAEDNLAPEFEHLRRSALSRAREIGPVVREVAEIRRQAALHHDAENIWAIGSFRGGLGDVALAAEYLQLRGSVPASGVASLQDTFEAAARRELLDAEAARELADAATLWQNLDGFFRMIYGGAFNPKATTAEQKQTIADIAQEDSFETLLRRISDTAVRTSVHLHEMLARAIRA